MESRYWSWSKIVRQLCTSSYVPVASVENALDSPVPYEYKYSMGSSVKQGNSTTLSANLSYEMATNFSVGILSIGPMSVKFSGEWSTSSPKLGMKASKLKLMLM